MPFESEAQRRKFYATPALHKYIPEFEAATPPGPLPQHVGDHMISPLSALISRAQGGPQGPSAGPEADGTPGDVKTLISRMVQLGAQAVSLEKDPVEREALSKIVALLHGFEAREQKQRDAAMGAGPAVQMLRRQQG